MKGLLAYKFLPSEIPIVPKVRGQGSSALLILSILATAFVIYLVVDAWMTWKRNRRLSKFFPHKQPKARWREILSNFVGEFVIYRVVDAWMAWKWNRHLSKFLPHKQAKARWWKVLSNHRRASVGVRK